MAGRGCCRELYSCIFDYSTPRIALIKSRKIGLMSRIVQLGILAYVIGWVFVWEKGYQEFDTVVSSASSKVKGVALTNTSELGSRIWDVVDYIIPAQEENAFFVMTNLIITENQTQGHCPEFSDKRKCCKRFAKMEKIPCLEEFKHVSGVCCQGFQELTCGSSPAVLGPVTGFQTGKCVWYSAAYETCEVFAWCPVENDTKVPRPAFLKEAENFTVLIKNNIWYPKFNFSKRNILPNISNTYLKNCVYDAVHHPFCPIFRLGSIVNEAGESFQDMAILGGVIGIQIKWNCDLDKNYSKCVPRYSFRRLDNRELDHNVSPGYNFRSAKYYKNTDNVETRTLMKVYGIRFDILVFGTAGKFDIIPTMINIGSGIALLGVTTVLCDFIVFQFFKKRHYYREKKYKYVEDYDELVMKTMDQFPDEKYFYLFWHFDEERLFASTGPCSTMDLGGLT